jgi:hypothetical protein
MGLLWRKRFDNRAVENFVAKCRLLLRMMGWTQAGGSGFIAIF